MAKKTNSDSNNNLGDNRPEGGLLPVSISTEMRESYLDYAMSVITTRALPDIRDGLKPVHRRILYTMSEMGLTSGARFRKSAAVVGDVLGKYHPHGDASVYDAMVKMAQPFGYRYPLVIGQGNFGSVDGDSAAAMRYTEAKMSAISGELLKDLEKNTVDFVPNYDGQNKEPTVLPSALPNTLLNGTLGIAVGMATNIPPHNLSEVVEATIHLIDQPNATTEDLLQFVKGPDFPLGGIIFGKKDIAHAYASGRGGIVCRGEAEIVETKGGGEQIVITSIPYRVNKSEMISKIADLVREKKLEGVKGLRDESTTDIRVVIDLKSGVQPQKVLNYLYKHTELESTFHMNMVALVDGVPQTLSLHSALTEFLSHRQIVVRRRTEFDLAKARDRAHILEGLKKALDHIDEVIKVIKASKDTPTAHANLMKKFQFSDRQTTAILEMRLQKLAGLERKKIEDELKELLKLIKELEALLASPKKILAVIKDELVEAEKKYGDPRRTRIVASGPKSFSVEDLVAEEESILVFTNGGYIKRTNPNEYKKQKRGGVGVVDLNTKEEDFVTMFLSTSTHSNLLFFSDKGKAYQMKMYEVPEGRRSTKGKSIMNFLSIGSDEKTTSILAVPKDMDGSTHSLLMVTKKGVVKKAAGDSFHDVRKSGIIAIKLSDGDELLSALWVAKGDAVVLATAKGQSVRFLESDVRQMGRLAGGVKALTLRKGDELVGVDVIKGNNNDFKLLTISEHGYGKKTPLSEYKVQKRGGSGIKTAAVTAKTGDLVGIKVLEGEEDELVAVSKKGQVIRLGVDEVSTLGRSTQGVRVMKPRTGDSVASILFL
ncbi:MAG TPA: DNA gyrase subunit A [Candidatus Paceibacterota bacterium]|nr:DNA gyrase subunit A [Candidatus Paceibacterota bacterium]